jgi:non-heme Fe2+,alpha-ketoglutarate-dependent halogenase
MMSLYVRSLGKRAYIDQPCRLSLEPRPAMADVQSSAMSEEELAAFYADGFIGPFRAMSEGDALELGAHITPLIASVSDALGIQTARDRHLDSDRLIDVLRIPAITDRLAQLLGPDLQVWRTQVFDKQPGAGPIAWHQASTYMVDDYRRPLLRPPDRDQLFQLTVWLAIDPATTDNGCIRFAATE